MMGTPLANTLGVIDVLVLTTLCRPCCAPREAPLITTCLAAVVVSDSYKATAARTLTERMILSPAISKLPPAPRGTNRRHIHARSHKRPMLAPFPPLHSVNSNPSTSK